MKKSLTIFAPATIANFGPCFDLLGVALNNPGDIIHAHKTKNPTVKITKITGDNGQLPLAENKNTVGVAAQAVLKKIKSKEGLAIEIEKNLPLGSGIGSSAASAAAGAFAAKELLNKKLTKMELLKACLEGEASACGAQHGDNVFPALLGGAVMIKSYSPLKIIQVNIPQITLAIITPKIEVKTGDSRAIITKEIRKKLTTEAPAKAQRILEALTKNDLKKLGQAVSENELLEKTRSQLIPAFLAMKKAALSSGAFACTISGSGPSLFTIVKNYEKGKKVGAAMQKALIKNTGLDGDILITHTSNQGARVVRNRDKNYLRSPSND